MKTNPIKAKDTEILVSGKGKTLDRILNKEGKSEESIPIVNINDNDIVSITADPNYPNQAIIRLQNSKTQEILDLFGEDTTKTICFIVNTSPFVGREIHAAIVLDVEIMTPGEISIQMIGVTTLVSAQEIETFYDCDSTQQIGGAYLFDILKRIYVTWGGTIQGSIN